MKKRKVKLADVLWRAANHHLSEEYSGFDWVNRIDYYSCNAAKFACERAKADTNALLAFLHDLGCPIGSAMQLREFQGRNRQGVRYMWLLLAMHVAEDEGIEIEVTE